MKTVMRPRYYCEHCKKGSGSPSHMRKHEAGCTNNPRRECGMCREAGLTQKPMEDLVTAFLSFDHDYDKGLKLLREVAEGCPACILATIRQAQVQQPPSFDCEDGVHVDFDFMKEKEGFWAVVNNSNAIAYAY